MQNQNAIGQCAGNLPDVGAADFGLFIGVADHQEVFSLARNTLCNAHKFGVVGVDDVRQDDRHH